LLSQTSKILESRKRQLILPRHEKLNESLSISEFPRCLIDLDHCPVVSDIVLRKLKAYTARVDSLKLLDDQLYLDEAQAKAVLWVEVREPDRADDVKGPGFERDAFTAVELGAVHGAVLPFHVRRQASFVHLGGYGLHFDVCWRSDGHRGGVH